MIALGIFKIKAGGNHIHTFVQGVNTEWGKRISKTDIRFIKEQFRSMGFKIRYPKEDSDYFSFEIVDTLSREL